MSHFTWGPIFSKCDVFSTVRFCLLTFSFTSIGEISLVENRGTVVIKLLPLQPYELFICKKEKNLVTNTIEVNIQIAIRYNVEMNWNCLTTCEPNIWISKLVLGILCLFYSSNIGIASQSKLPVVLCRN